MQYTDNILIDSLGCLYVAIKWEEVRTGECAFQAAHSCKCTSVITQHIILIATFSQKINRSWVVTQRVLYSIRRRIEHVINSNTVISHVSTNGQKLIACENYIQCHLYIVFIKIKCINRNNRYKNSMTKLFCTIRPSLGCFDYLLPVTVSNVIPLFPVPALFVAEH